MSDLTSTSGHATQRGHAGAYPIILISLLFLGTSVRLALPAIGGGVFNALSTDDAMRLVEVRDLIGGQGWFDLFQYRLDPPGMLMHWSRVIDAPLAGLILLLKPLLGTHNAEAVTLYFWPALLFAVALVLIAAIARQLSNNVNALIAAAVLAVLALPALVHFRAGAIDHHNAQIDLLLALVLMTAQLERSAVKAALGGLFVSLSLAIGIEMLPALAAVGLAVFGLFVWRGRPVARQVGAFGAGLAASSLLLAPALIPWSSLGAQVCDAFGGPVLLLATGGGVSLLLMIGIDRYRPTLGMRLVGGAALAIVLAGAFLFLYSGCIASPFAHLDPIVVQLWINNVAEAISFTRMLRLFPENVPAYYGFPILTAVLAVMALRHSPPSDRFRWIVGIVTLAALIGTSLWQMRGAAGASMVAAPLFAASLAMLWPRAFSSESLPRTRSGMEPVRVKKTRQNKEIEPPFRFNRNGKGSRLASARNLLVLSVLASPVGLSAAGLFAKPLLDVIFRPQAIPDAPSCRSMSDVAALNQLPKGRVMAPVDLGPAILAETADDVFAAPYHRNNDGNTALIKLMLAPLPTARQILSDRRVDYVVTCSTTHDLNIIKLAPDGLEARLDRGETPDFLELLHLDLTDKISIWRVRR